MIKQFRLYSSEGCHLCEQALELALQVIEIEKIEIIDIVDDEKLVELYGTSIPVIERISDKQKLYWPFEQQQINNLV